MARSYSEKIGCISEAEENGSIPNSPALHWCTDGEGHKFFRLDLDLPALFMLSEPVSRFKAYRQYVIPLAEERKYYADFAMIPAYFGNFNRMTCIDLYGDQAAAFFAAGSRPLGGPKEIFWRFEPSGSVPAQFSSMNFVLKWSSREGELPESFSSVLSLYFQYAFWVLPGRGFASNAHLIHSRDNISRIMKVAKSLYIVREIGEVHVERIAPYYSAQVQKAGMDVITNSGEVRRVSAYLSKDVAERLRAHDSGAGGTLINGVVYEFKDKVPRAQGGLGMLSVVEDFIPTDYDLFRTLAGMSASEMFRRNTATMGEIGNCDELKRRIAWRYRRYIRNAEVEGTLLSRIDRPVEYLVDSLFPILIRDGDRVSLLHPIILSALLSLGLEKVIEQHEAGALIAFVHLLQKMRTEKPVRLRFSEEAQLFKCMGVDFSVLLRAAYSAFCGIQISRLLAEYF
jgi:hypothetical protein